MSTVVIANVLYLDGVLFQSRDKQQSQQLLSSTQPQTIPVEIKNKIDGLTADITSLTTQIAQLKIDIENVQSKKSEPIQQKQQSPSTTTATSAREYYIPLGTGSTTNNQWEDVAGAETYLDPASYTGIRHVYFEASLRIPVANGTVYARLYNVTDNHPVWYSEVSTSKGTSTRMVSENITLDKGNKLYRVQMKTSLQYPSYLDFARIKIEVK